MATPDEIKIRIIARDEASKVFRKTQNASDGLLKRLGALRIGILAAGAASIYAFNRMANSIDRVAKISSRLGITTEALSQLQYAAEISGVSVETLTMALQRSTRRIAEAAKGTGEAKDALKELGLSASEMVKLSPDKQLEAIATAMESVENQSDKVRLAMKLFDSEGVALLQTMEGGGAAIRQMRLEAAQLGATISGAEAKNMEVYNDSVTKLATAFGGLTKSLMALVAKPLTYAIEKITEFVQYIGRLIGKFKELFGVTDEQTKAIDDMTKSIIEADIVISKKFLPTTEKMRASLIEIGGNTKYVAMSMQDVANNGIRKLEDAIVDFAMGAKNLKDTFKDMARSIIADLIRMQVQQNITGRLFNMMNYSAPTRFATASGYTTVPSTAGPSTAMPQFEGGGYTGMGGRSGGVDGRGGFPAILHPNETVVDHTKGQSMGGSVNVTLNVSTGVSQTVRSEIANLLPQITQATKAAVADARMRGGSFSKSMVGA